MESISIYGVYLIIYFMVIIAIGFYHSRKVKSMEDYLIARWDVGFLVIVGTMIATLCGAAAFIGFVGMGFATGISGIFYWIHSHDEQVKAAYFEQLDMSAYNERFTTLDGKKEGKSG